jgi:osmotically-inducible protein OsmY
MMAERVRTDEEIRDDVLDELEWDPAIPEASQIGVAVDNGVVTLSGVVDSYPVKRAAEEAARRVEGVRAIANDIEVRVPSAGVRSDTDIAAAATNALEWDSQVPSDRIKVVVRNGWVTLEGTVDWHYQKEAAERDVRNLQGVRGVTNLIKVAAPQISPAEVKARIERALERSAQLEAQRINVQVEDGKLILTGRVRSMAERDQVEAAAWSTKGVSEVENRIVVSP